MTYYEKNKERIKAYSKAYQEKNKEAKKIYNKAYKARKKNEADELYENQSEQVRRYADRGKVVNRHWD